MKLRIEDDRLSFLADVGRIDLFESTEPLDDELFEIFIKRRRPLVRRLVGFRQKQLTQSSWRKNRWKFLTGIHKWHRSVQGKRFHRALGRFLATRIIRPKLLTTLGTHFEKQKKERYESLDILQDQALKAISSIRTHLYIDLGYYQSLEEEADLFQLLEHAIPLLNAVELKLFENSEAELTEDEHELLLRLLDEREFFKSVADTLEVDCDNVISTYNAVCSNTIKEGMTKDNTYFMTKIVEGLMSSLVVNLDRNKEVSSNDSQQDPH
jgi:hypothetical protein